MLAGNSASWTPPPSRRAPHLQVTARLRSAAVGWRVDLPRVSQLLCICRNRSQRWVGSARTANRADTNNVRQLSAIHHRLIIYGASKTYRASLLHRMIIIKARLYHRKTKVSLRPGGRSWRSWADNVSEMLKAPPGIRQGANWSNFIGLLKADAVDPLSPADRTVYLRPGHLLG